MPTIITPFQERVQLHWKSFEADSLEAWGCQDLRGALVPPPPLKGLSSELVGDVPNVTLCEIRLRHFVKLVK